LAGLSGTFVLVVEVTVSDDFFFITDRLRDYVRPSSPFAEIDFPAAIAAEREVGRSAYHGLLANRTTKFDAAGHRGKLEQPVRFQQ
jgi:hypothetical protein